jgi:hypothetical protein
MWQVLSVAYQFVGVNQVHMRLEGPERVFMEG